MSALRAFSAPKKNRQGKIDITCDPAKDNHIDWDCVFVSGSSRTIPRGRSPFSGVQHELRFFTPTAPTQSVLLLAGEMN